MWGTMAIDLDLGQAVAPATHCMLANATPQPQRMLTRHVAMGLLWDQSISTGVRSRTAPCQARAAACQVSSSSVSATPPGGHPPTDMHAWQVWSTHMRAWQGVVLLHPATSSSLILWMDLHAVHGRHLLQRRAQHLGREGVVGAQRQRAVVLLNGAHHVALHTHTRRPAPGRWGGLPLPAPAQLPAAGR